MKNRPRWSAAAFAQRVKMSEDDLWLIVEGRDHDRSHYDKLLRTIPATKERRVSIRLAESIELNGTSAGGKKHALALHDHLETVGKLATDNKSGVSKIAFMVDRDRDDYTGTMRESLHIFYTHSTDVEADILLNTDVWTALQVSYGVDRGITDKLRGQIQDPAVELVSIWQSWLTLGLVALSCNVTDQVHWGKASALNLELFGPVDADTEDRLSSAISSKAGIDTFQKASLKASIHLAKLGVRLLKGRWLARYVKHLVDTRLKNEVIRANVQTDTIIAAAQAALTYDGDWVAGYNKRFARLLGYISSDSSDSAVHEVHGVEPSVV